MLQTVVPVNPCCTMRMTNGVMMYGHPPHIVFMLHTSLLSLAYVSHMHCMAAQVLHKQGPCGHICNYHSSYQAMSSAVLHRHHEGLQHFAALQAEDGHSMYSTGSHASGARLSYLGFHVLLLALLSHSATAG